MPEEPASSSLCPQKKCPKANDSHRLETYGCFIICFLLDCIHHKDSISVGVRNLYNKKWRWNDETAKFHAFETDCPDHHDH